jgi:hypothetical protein
MEYHYTLVVAIGSKGRPAEIEKKTGANKEQRDRKSASARTREPSSITPR